MITPDNIFAEALERLDRGETPQQIAKDYLDYQQELEGLLSVADMGMNIPRIEPPTPYKAFRFADKAVTSSGLMQFLQFGRVAIIPIGLVMVLLGGRIAVNATENSLPGERLYTIKRATEEARLTLTRDQEKIANIHVELLQKRLEDVRKAASKGTEAGETAAIAELQSQTKITFAEAAPVATANALSKQDSTLLETLVAVNKEQKTVLASLSASGDTNNAKTLAISAINDNKENDVTLARIVATISNQALLDLPNRMSVTGEVTLNANNRIVVEKNTFLIDAGTRIIGPDGEKITDILTVKGKVTITGTKVADGSLLAKQILLTPEDGTVKGQTVATPPSNTSAKPNTNIESTTPIEEPATVEPLPRATGSYITEPSAPQYVK